MAFTGKAVYDDGAVHGDLSDVVSNNDERRTPFLTVVGDAPKAAESTTHTWPEDAINTNVGQLAEALDNSETEIDVDDGTLYSLGDVIRIDDELIGPLTVIATNTLTGARSYGSPAAATHADNAPIYIMAPRLEGAAASADVSTARATKTNYTQIFSETVDVSRSARSVNMAGVADELDYQVEQRIDELLQELERACLYSVISASAGSGTVARSMKGVQEWISTNTAAASSAALDEDYLMTQITAFYAGGMKTADSIFCNIYQKAAISRMNRNFRFVPGESKKNTLRVDQLETDAGIMNVYLTPNMKPDQVLFVDSMRVGVAPLTGGSFQIQDLAKIGDADRKLVVGEYTLQFRNENAHGLITGLATS